MSASLALAYTVFELHSGRGEKRIGLLELDALDRFEFRNVDRAELARAGAR